MFVSEVSDRRADDSGIKVLDWSFGSMKHYVLMKFSERP
jgi:hypothetical protein